MNTLSSNWVTEGWIDYEYKKYLLLAYLQSVSKHFNENKIYPLLSDLVFHYRNLIALRDNKTLAEQNFPKKLSRLDFENFRLHYEKMLDDDNCMEEIESIINFAIPKMADHINIAKNIYDDVEDNIDISAVGIIPMNKDEGYLLFRQENHAATDVFAYGLTIFENMHEKYRGLKTVFVESYPKAIYNYDEAIKLDLIKRNSQLPNPATYVIHCKKNYPFNETLFPVAKRRFVRFLEK